MSPAEGVGGRRRPEAGEDCEGGPGPPPRGEAGSDVIDVYFFSCEMFLLTYRVYTGKKPKWKHSEFS